MRHYLPLLLLLAGCELDPLVDDEPGASVHVLPPGSEVPRVDEEPERVYQIQTHDGLDDGDLEDSGNVVLRQTGWADGAAVAYWNFGPVPRIGAPVYVFYETSNDGEREIDHPWLLDTMPGDPGYSPFRRIQRVQVTARYQGEVIPSVRALTDAIDLGLVREPENTGSWINAPVVPPGVEVEVREGDSAAPREVIAAGYRVDMMVFGDERGVQPLRSGGIPMAQAAVVREPGAARYGSEPIFQLGPPAEAPGEDYNYTPLCTVVQVDLADGVDPELMIDDDADLFIRSGSGQINGTTALVDDFEITDELRNWPIQFEEGAP